MSDTSASYLDAFPATDETQWRSKVDGVLKGKAFEALVSKSYDGIAIAPLYAPASAAAPVAQTARTWSVLQRIDIPDAREANAQALDDLGNGAAGLQLVFAGGLGAYGFGLMHDAASIDALLANVYLDAEAPVEIDALDGGAAALAVADFIARRKVDVAATRVAFGIDPFGALARGIETSVDIASIAKDLSGRGFAGPLFVADARLVHAAGGSEAQELAYAVASALATLRLLEGGSIPLNEARGMIAFRIAADADEFLGIAKLRALRKLWASVEEQCGLTPAPAHIHAETAWRMMTRRDPDVNMLRATLAVFAAAIGGADRISVIPHTQAVGLPDAFARRVARNIQLVLDAESHLAKVADPAAGSGSFETLTDELCAKAWDAFRAIEAEGGLTKALAGSTFRNAVADVAKARAKNVARRRDALTGVSEFPQLAEKTPGVLAPLPTASPSGPFAPDRLSEPFEVLRDKADATLAESGARPKVFLATLGSVAAFTPRATFAKNLFEAGGLETVQPVGADDPAALAAAFHQSKAIAACLCSSDAVYAQAAEAAAQALKDAGAKRILLAGRPGDLEASLRAAGVTDFAFAGGDVLALLERLHAA